MREPSIISAEVDIHQLLIVEHREDLAPVIGRRRAVSDRRQPFAVANLVELYPLEHCLPNSAGGLVDDHETNQRILVVDMTNRGEPYLVVETVDPFQVGTLECSLLFVLLPLGYGYVPLLAVVLNRCFGHVEHERGHDACLQS